ncbi:hypothetical protein [Thiobacillus denitrificans]|uniref:hypothetical protein n=1 Tax=Thiobacillus denitrificans TaxID=36861 RepID=UPI000B31F906|nr:hypothetical protein [Thiobacillus denitrificans]
MARLSLPGPAEFGRFALIVGLAALAYALAGWLSLKLATYVSGVIAAVWLAAGIGAVASLRFGAAGVVGVLRGGRVAGIVGGLQFDPAAGRRVPHCARCRRRGMDHWHPAALSACWR